MRQNKMIMRSLVLLGALFFWGNSFAQISLSVNKQTIKQIIPQIEKASGYNVFYTDKLPNLETKKDLNVSNASLEAVLKELFKGTKISFEIKANKQILLFQQTNKSVGAKKKVTGRIVDENDEPLIGASVIIKGSTQGTITNIDGEYTLEDVPEKATLTVSYVGYIPASVAVNGKNAINVVLQEDSKTLEEVVVIGYGTVKKKDLTGAVGSVGGAEVAARKTTSLSTALQGTIPGLMVTRNNNAPGANADKIYVRGITTIGNSDPLVIVDGVPGDINSVNANDVESISVLKDAASAAIYGSRAAAGVILVTTKRASDKELSLTYNGEFGWEIPTAEPEVVGVQRFLEMANELRYTDNPDGGKYQAYSEDQVNNWVKNNATNPNQYPITDWQDLILEKSATRQSHSIHLSGGSKVVKTKASLAYDEVGGLYGDRYFQRYTLRVNNDFNITQKLSATLDFNVKRTKHHMPQFTPFGMMRYMPAIYAGVWDDGRIAEGKSGANPYGLMKLGGTTEKWYTALGGKASIDFKPFDGFKISAIVAPRFNYDKFKTFKKAASYTLADDPNTIGGYLDNSGLYNTTKLSETRNDSYNVTTQLIANYAKKFAGKHDINLMAGYENYYEYIEELGADRDGYVLTNFPYLSNGPKDLIGNSGKGKEYAYRSYFGRVMYSYADRYLFQANIRHDGSSRFAKKHRWGTFPSFSAGWVLSEENFMKNLNWDWLSFLKIRATWGALGNERIGDFPYMSTIAFGNTIFYQNNGIYFDQTASQQKYAIENVTWEKTESTDIGLDISFLNNRLRVNGDYYWKNTKDMLLAMAIPDFLGFSDPDVNAGKMSTKGYELNVSWNDHIGDFSYGIAINFSDFTSKMGDLQGTQFLGDKVKMEGSEFNEWYGYVSDGLFLTEEDLKNSPKINDKNTQLGDIKYKDISGPDGVPDGKISPEYDRVLLGSSLPHFLYGGNINLGYKNFDLSLAFQGVGKQNARLAREMVEPFRNNYGNFPAIIDGNYWSPYNTDEQNAVAKYPRLTHVNKSSNYAMSDYWLFNGGYFRLKNITLGYTFPKEWMNAIGIKGARIYASASDLFCLSKYPKGWDPEMGVSEYPITTSILLGVSVNF